MVVRLQRVVLSTVQEQSHQLLLRVHRILLTSFLNSVNSDCEPTPLAVSRALWGHLENSGDPIVLIDVGGATTDVHSVGGIIHRQRSVDLPTPDVLRTVEGDLGMRWGAPGIVQSLGERLSL